MPEYIDKSVILDQISKQKLFYEEKRKQSGNCLEEMNCVGAENGLTALEDIISDIPAADVAPVVHGKWEFEPETINTYSVLKCSKCGWWTLDLSVDGSYHHCPHCGAKLDLEDD